MSPASLLGKGSDPCSDLACHLKHHTDRTKSKPTQSRVLSFGVANGKQEDDGQDGPLDHGQKVLCDRRRRVSGGLVPMSPSRTNRTNPVPVKAHRIETPDICKLELARVRAEVLHEVGHDLRVAFQWDELFPAHDDQGELPMHLDQNDGIDSVGGIFPCYFMLSRALVSARFVIEVRDARSVSPPLMSWPSN